MKLYSKHFKLMDYSSELNDDGFWLDGRNGNLMHGLDYPITSGSRFLRHQAYLDIEIIGRNYVNTPFLLKRPKNER